MKFFTPFLSVTVTSLFLQSCQPAVGKKVLLVPVPFAESHWMAQASLGRALVNRGHVVTALMSEDSLAERRSAEFLFETFDDHGTRARLKALESQVSNAAEMSLVGVIQAVSMLPLEMAKHCDFLFGDGELLQRLRESRYGAVVTDPFFPCGAILAAHLRVPHVVHLRSNPYRIDLAATGVPQPPAYVPDSLLPFTDHMTFLQRTQNVVVSSLVSLLSQWILGSNFDGLVRKFVGEDETLLSAISRADLWLYQTDNVLDFPAPSMPNMIQVGGLNVREVVPLAADLETFVQSSGEDGVVVVSFGSIVKTMPTDRAEVWAAALARLRQKVVWRYTGEKPAGLGNNTKAGWLPQNDLLGHPKTRAFVTHAGYNGVSEALHHGVPMVCVPFFGDQPSNAARVVARGLGVKVEFSTVTTDELYQTILHVLTNNSYQDTAARLSHLHRDQPQSPMKRAVWWIEHVIKHGGLPHLRARAVDLPWYQYHLLDVAAFLLAVCAAVLGTVWYSCAFVCRLCYRKGSGKLKRQ
ncbi:UDP-glucuronosyltransferase 1-2-like [Branchiostoma floridae]|uniref:UDP-glucuronosyltransferase n=1 Tax=Branchiostoma floridae TaxID=7739 RepID=A0A9J7LH19_BRAFL|nr:UDP-glucuronosyltransferase 1-2-like [Branchiostoma floridae]